MGRTRFPACAAMVDAIRRYLSARPDAGDDARGIVRWWLSGDPATAGSLAQIEIALDRLEAAGEIECLRLAERTVYRPRRCRRGGRSGRR